MLALLVPSSSFVQWLELALIGAGARGGVGFSYLWRKTKQNLEDIRQLKRQREKDTDIAGLLLLGTRHCIMLRQ